jgi:hypothetical protein
MAINIGQLTTEIIGESDHQLAGEGATTPSTDPMEELARLRSVIAEAVRLDQRTRAEGFDD